MYKSIMTSSLINYTYWFRSAFKILWMYRDLLFFIELYCKCRTWSMRCPFFEVFWCHLLVYCSVTQSCPTLCDPTDCSTTGFPVLHHLPELAQMHVHWVGDAIQPSHPLSPIYRLASVFPSIRVFSSKLAFRIRWPKCWNFSFSISPSSEYSGLTSFRID